MKYVTEHIKLIKDNLKEKGKKPYKQPNPDSYIIMSTVSLSYEDKIMKSAFNHVDLFFKVLFFNKKDYNNDCLCLVYPVDFKVTILYIGSEFISFEEVGIMFSGEETYGKSEQLELHLKGNKHLVNEVTNVLLNAVKTLIVNN